MGQSTGWQQKRMNFLPKKLLMLLTLHESATVRHVDRSNEMTWCCPRHGLGPPLCEMALRRAASVRHIIVVLYFHRC